MNRMIWISRVVLYRSKIEVGDGEVPTGPKRGMIEVVLAANLSEMTEAWAWGRAADELVDRSNSP